MEREGGSSALRVNLLGGFQIRTPDRVVGEDGWRVRKAKSVVKLVALSPCHRLDRDAVMEWLWPDLGPRAAANNLRFALHAARSLLGEDVLPSRGSSIALGGATRWVDADAFEDAAAAALRSRERTRAAAALEIYGGDLLPDDRYEDWSIPRRERLRDLYHALLDHAAELADGAANARALRERLIASDPTHERARVWLMRSYAASGERQRALRHYDQLVAVLLAELDARPDAETTQLRDQIAAGANAPLMRPAEAALE